MTERNFRKKWLGYDPAQVEHACLENDDRMRSVSIQLKAAETKIATLSDQLVQAERRTSDVLQSTHSAQQKFEEQSAALAESASYDQLGERVAQILSLADTEATELRSGAEQDAAEARADADLYAEEVRIVAEEEGAKAIEEARATAVDERRASESDAIAMRTEAAGLLEAQKVAVARASAELETFLADRRELVVAELEAQQLASQAEFEAGAARNRELETSLADNRAEADKRIAQMLEDAHERAEELLADARAAAERVRTESEREILAATQRRDSVNAQVASARETLVALTGAASPAKAPPVAEAEAESASTPEPEAVVVPTQSASKPKSKAKAGLKLVSNSTLTPTS